MTARRTVLHLIDTGGPGGAETIFFNLVSGLAADRWRSVAVVPEKDWLWHELEQHGITPVYLPTNGSFDIKYLNGVARLARKHGADLIQTHLFSSAVYASVAAKLRRLPVVCTFHGPTDFPNDDAYRGTKLRILRRRRNSYVFVSHKLESCYLDWGVVDPIRSHVIPNGIDCQYFHPATDEDMRRELGASGDDILVGAVGNLRAPKDYPTFVKAAALLAARSRRYRFVIVGAADEPIRSELLTMVAELGLADRFLLAGFKSDVARVMNALDVYVLSSSSEGFSLTTVQAMASGVPVVATRCGGPEEIVRDGETGVLVAPRDAHALACAVDRLATDPVLRVTFAANSRARAVAEFSTDKMIAGYAHLYDQCLGSRTTRFRA